MQTKFHGNAVGNMETMINVPVAKGVNQLKFMREMRVIVIEGPHMASNTREPLSKKKQKQKQKTNKKNKQKNKAEYTATPVVCGWAGALFEVIWAGALRSKK